jgi:hypothetical protein
VRRSLGKQPLVVGADVLSPAPVGVVAGLRGKQDFVIIADVLFPAEATRNRLTADVLFPAEATRNRLTADVLFPAEATRNRLTEQVHRAFLIGGCIALAVHILQGTHGR